MVNFTQFCLSLTYNNYLNFAPKKKKNGGLREGAGTTTSFSESKTFSSAEGEDSDGPSA